MVASGPTMRRVATRECRDRLLLPGSVTDQADIALLRRTMYRVTAPAISSIVATLPSAHGGVDPVSARSPPGAPPPGAVPSGAVPSGGSGETGSSSGSSSAAVVGVDTDASGEVTF